MPEFYLRQDLAAVTTPEKLFTWAGEIANSAAPEWVYRNKEGRKTLRFESAGKSYFLKLHTGVGWAEIVKNLIQLRLPVLGASNEYRAVAALRAVGVDTMSVAAYASEGRNPAALQSLIVTDDLVGTITLEDFCANWVEQRPQAKVRLGLIKKLADSSALMHRAGINHRDFYLCHFHLDPETLKSNAPSIRCYLIDLHRAQIRTSTPRRWLVKDLAGLYFSAMDAGLSQRDLLRFMRHYSSGGLKQALGEHSAVWRDVARRAHRLYQKEHGRKPPELLVGLPRSPSQ